MLIQLMKDITQGSEMGKAMAFYTLDALVAMDADQAVLTQLQTRGLLQGCLQDISTNSYQVRSIHYQQSSEESLLDFLSAYLAKTFYILKAVLLPSPASVRRLYTLEAELSLLLRVGHQSKKQGARTLFSMGVLQHLTSCKAIDVQLSVCFNTIYVNLHLKNKYQLLLK